MDRWSIVTTLNYLPHDTEIGIVQSFRQQHVPGTMLVRHRAVARFAGNENNLGFVCRKQIREAAKEEKPN